MDTIFNDVCVLVTAAFTLTLVPRCGGRSALCYLKRDHGMTLLGFLVLGLVEEATVSRAGLFNERIVAVCAAGLVAGPWVGLTISVFVTSANTMNWGNGIVLTATNCGSSTMKD